MPEFPRYESKGSLTTRQPSAMAVEDTSGQMIEKVGEVGQTIQKETLKWSNAVDTIQKTTSEANFKMGLLDIQQRAQNDPDYNNSAKYYQEIEKLKTDSLKGFSSKMAENEMAINLNYQGKVGQIQVENVYKKKLIDVGQTSSMRLIDAEVANPTDGSLDRVRAELGRQIQAGVFDRKDAYILERKANDDLGVNRINRDLYQAQTPEAVDEVTSRITSGEYEKGGVTIEPDKKKSLLDIAERARTNTEKKIQAQQVEAMAQNRVETFAGIASGQIPIDSLNMSELAEYDPQLAGALTKVKDFMVDYNPKLPANQQSLSSAGLLNTQQVMQMKSYARSITDTFLQDDNQKLGEFMIREFEKKGDGLTSSVKLAAFANLAALKSKVNNQKTKEDAGAGQRFSAIKAGVKFLEASNAYLAPQAIGDFVVRNFLSGSVAEAAVMQEAKSVLRDAIIDRYKSVSKLPTLPNKLVDGEASVEDLQAGLNELNDGDSSGDYADTE
jgi:hypothetical protein